MSRRHSPSPDGQMPSQRRDGPPSATGRPLPPSGGHSQMRFRLRHFGVVKQPDDSKGGHANSNSAMAPARSSSDDERAMSSYGISGISSGSPVRRTLAT